jgi:Na+/melibiose symporter-like transporter
MPLRLFKNRTTVCCYFITFFHGFAFIAGCYFLPLFFQSARGNSPLLSGVFILPFVIPLSVASGAAGIIIAKTGRYQELIWGGLLLMTLGFGLFIDLDRTSNWGKLVMYQFIAGLGAGPLFQAPLIAVHSTLEPKDIATGTSTFAFVRTLGTALGISLGLVVFQNGMQSQAGKLASQHLDPTIVRALTGESASASIEFIKTFGGPVRRIAQDAYAMGMKEMWYFFLATSVCGLIASIGVKKHHLSTQLNSSQPMKNKKPKKDSEAAAAAVAMKETDEDPEKDAGDLA